MKVLLLNGSPRAKGCTYTALSEVAATLHGHGVQTELFQLGSGDIHGCTACGSCKNTGKCAIDDAVNRFLDMVPGFDGIVVGSPVYYAGAAGQLCAFLDRAFFAGAGRFAHKPAAAVVSCRRGGASAAFDKLNKYFTISNMFVVGSQYWNQVHGHTPTDVLQDLEGLQTMRTLGHNMAWLLRCIEAGKAAGIQPPELEQKIFTNFIR
ncbi:MAG: flavodoxin family protein [Christensenellaceae bacterium]|jgi:multimeric flavodoxin WrbA|nr:flavodoxin family protein [Christensenellaceae bacterium]